MKVTLDFDNETMEFDRDVSVKDLRQFVKEHQLQRWSVKSVKDWNIVYPNVNEPYVNPYPSYPHITYST